MKLPRAIRTQADAWKLADDVGCYVNDITFAREPAIVLELEKLYKPFLNWPQKKRYVGRKFESATDKAKLEFKGVELTRRDIPQCVKTIYASALAAIMPDDVLAGLTLKDVQDRLGPVLIDCLLYTSPSPRDVEESRMPSSA